MEELSNKKRVRDDSGESELDSPEVKRLRDDLLGNLDDSYLFTMSQDLDLFMKSFEEEISAFPSTLPSVAVVDLTSDSGDSQPELGYLLEASDDELGIPPSGASSSKAENNENTELAQVLSDSSELAVLCEFEDQIPSYDLFGFGIGDSSYSISNGEYVALDGLFDYSDISIGSSDFFRRSEKLPAQ